MIKFKLLPLIKLQPHNLSGTKNKHLDKDIKNFTTFVDGRSFTRTLISHTIKETFRSSKHCPDYRDVIIDYWFSI